MHFLQKDASSAVTHALFPIFFRWVFRRIRLLFFLTLPTNRRRRKASDRSNPELRFTHFLELFFRKKTLLCHVPKWTTANPSPSARPQTGVLGKCVDVNRFDEARSCNQVQGNDCFPFNAWFGRTPSTLGKRNVDSTLHKKWKILSYWVEIPACVEIFLFPEMWKAKTLCRGWNSGACEGMWGRVRGTWWIIQEALFSLSAPPPPLMSHSSFPGAKWRKEECRGSFIHYFIFQQFCAYFFPGMLSYCENIKLNAVEKQNMMTAASPWAVTSFR